MVKKLFGTLKKFLPLIGVALFFYLIYNLGVQDILNALFSIPPTYIVLASLLTIPRVLIRNYAWILIQKEQKIHLSFFRSLKIFLMGYFYGSVTPGYIGQLMRVPYMKERTGEPYGKLFVNSVIETILHTLSLYGMMIIGAILVFGSFPELFYITGTWVVGLGLILIYFIKRERGEKIFSFLIRNTIPKKFRDKSNKFVNTFYRDFPQLKRLLLPLFIGIFTWIIIFTQEYIIILALGLNIPYLYFLLLFPIANTAGFIPITFAGLGTREAVSILIFTTLFSVADHEVFVFTLVGFLITDILTGFVGFLLTLTETRAKINSIKIVD